MRDQGLKRTQNERLYKLCLPWTVWAPNSCTVSALFRPVKAPYICSFNFHVFSTSLSNPIPVAIKCAVDADRSRWLHMMRSKWPANTESLVRSPETANASNSPRAVSCDVTMAVRDRMREPRARECGKGYASSGGPGHVKHAKAAGNKDAWLYRRISPTSKAIDLLHSSKQRS